MNLAWNFWWSYFFKANPSSLICCTSVKASGASTVSVLPLAITTLIAWLYSGHSLSRKNNSLFFYQFFIGSCDFEKFWKYRQFFFLFLTTNTCIYVTPLVTLDTANVSDLDPERLIPYFAVAFAVALSRSVVFSLPLKFVFRFVVFLFSFFFSSRRRFVHKIHTEFVFALFAQECSA